jgi:cytochrome c
MNLEFNKIFAALLIAGITASGSSFVARKIMSPHGDAHHEHAVPVEGVESVASAAESGPSGPEPVLALLAAADVAQGEKLSKACAACHSFDKGGANRVGPNLWNVVGIQKGHHEGFAYSEALSAKGGAWGYTELNQFLYKPKDYITGTKMNYIGLKKPEDRAAIIAWLRTLSDSPVPMPSEADIATETAALAPQQPVIMDEAAQSEEKPSAVESKETTPVSH